MTLTVSHISGMMQNVMQKADARTYTIPQFKAMLDLHRTTQFLGPDGTKVEEQPYKDGKAIVPVEMDWDAPQCSCLVDRKRRPIAFNLKYAHMPAVRHRAKKHVVRSTHAVVIDADNQTWAELQTALDRIEADGLDFSAWGTHSDGRIDKGDKRPARIIVYTSDTVAPEMMPLARTALAERYGITLDNEANTPVTLFFLPSCPDSPRRKALAWIRHSKALGLLVQADLFGKGATRTLERLQAKRVARKEDLLAVGGVASPEHQVAAAKDLERYCSYLASHTQEHVREYVRSCYRFGAFVGAGALPSMVAVEDKIQDALKVRNLVMSDDNYSNHTSLITSALDYGFQEPFLPDTAEDAEGVEAVMQQLDEGLDFTFIKNVEVLPAITKILREREERELTVIVVSAGGGKTHAVLIDMAARHRRGQASLLLAPRHALISQLMERVGVQSARHRSPAAIIEGEDNCRWDAAIFPRLAARHGLNIKRDVCSVCPMKGDCALYKKSKQEDRLVHFGAHQLPLVAVTAQQPDVTVYVDEMPELHQKSEATVEEMNQGLTLENLDVSMAHGLVAIHKHWLGKSKPEVWDIQTANTSEVRLLKGIAPEIALADEPTLRTLRVLQALRIWSAGEAVGERVVLTDLALHLKNQGGVLLTATPDRRTLLELGAKLYEVHVQDEHPDQTTRLVLYRSESSRRYIAPKGIVVREAVEKAARTALVMAREAGNRTVLLVSYKAVVELLDELTLAKEHGFDKVDLAYYGNLTGMDHWKSFDAFVTLFDPYTPSGDFGFDYAREMARGELCQAHGRARDPNRKNGAWHLHVGQLAPYEWHSDNTQVVRQRGGRPPKVDKRKREPTASRKNLFNLRSRE